jgi:hypothetical protein
MIPVTTMRIEYEGQDEETHVAEFTLTTESVKEFADEIRKAQQKLKVLGQSIIQWIPDGLPTQNIPYTDTDDTFIQMQTFISSSRVQ